MNFLPVGSNPSTAGFTCNTCEIKFQLAEFQRQHMKTDWHRYNLKRRVAQLPGILSEAFAEKVLASAHKATHSNEDEFGFPIHHRRNLGHKQLTKKALRQMSRGRTVATSHLELRLPSPAVSVASELSQFSLGDLEALSEAETLDSHLEPNHSEPDWATLSDDDWSDEGSENEAELVAAAGSELLNTDCFYCGRHSNEIEANVRHMSRRHGLYVPERSYLVDLDGLLTFVREVITLDFECLCCGFEGKGLESIRQHLLSKGHCRIPFETAAEKEVIAEFYDFSVDEAPRQGGAPKHVSFGVPTNHTESASDSTPESLQLTLVNGVRVGHRALRPTKAPREYPEATRTVALVDRRFTSGLASHEITKQEKEVWRLETRARNLHERRTKLKRANYQAHFRDEILGT